MGSIWLHNLPDALENLRYVSFFKGWESRCRSSGGYNALMGIVAHHTASSTSAYNDTNYMWNNSPTKPVGAIYLARNGEIIVGAAGATNCAGRGGPRTVSRGTIAKDTANSNTISIEAGNAGTGEPWPKVQQDAYVALVAALCEYYHLDPPRDVMAHHEWAPDRKIDPAGNSRYAMGGNKWNMDLFRKDVAFKIGDGTAPTPPPSTAPVTGGMERMLIAKYGGTPTSGWGGWYSHDGGKTRVPVKNGNHAALLVDLGALDGKTKARVTSRDWTGVSHTTSQTTLDSWLTPYK
jgi:hypothetical protein